MKAIALLSLFLVLPAIAAPRATAPDWDVVPAGVTEALCQRLKMDAVATGNLSIVRITQPLVTAASLAVLPGPKKKKRRPSVDRPSNRAIPIALGRGGCHWQPIDAADISSKHDEMVVELSAPLANPHVKGEAGLFVRVSLGSEHPAWYWISLVPRDEGWTLRFIHVLSR